MFFTPGGLKIRIPLEVAFSFIARLHPDRKGIDVLRTTDGLDKFPSFFTDIVVLVLLFYQFDLWPVVIGAVLSTLVFTLMVVFGIFTSISNLIWRLHRVMPDIVRLAVVFCLSFLIQGIDGLKITLAALLIAFVIGELVTQIFIAMIFKMTISELEFFQAFKYHAQKIGIHLIDQPTDEEIESGKWLVSVADYVSLVPSGIPLEQQQVIAKVIEQDIN